MKKRTSIPLRKIIQKVVKGTATAEEIQFLELYYDQFDGREDILSRYSEQDLEKLEQAIKTGARADTTEEIFPDGRVRPLYLRRWAAAAILLLVMCAGLWYILKPGSNISGPITVQQTSTNDILPGGNKATLTLADGSTIILDSANNGNISKQGPVDVIKLDDGQLAYQPETRNAKPATVLYNTITTPRGGQYQVVLADGSKVWLNAASTITFPASFTGKERNVSITGEAYFEVAHDASKPFRVSVGDMKVEVLGTHFNVNAYADEGEIKTTLLAGSVKVHTTNKSVTIKPDEQAVLTTSNSQVVINKDVDLEEVMAWKNGLFYFNNADVRTVMRQLSRWYDVDIIYKGIIPERKFEGEMQKNLDLSQALKLLDQNRVNFEVVGRQIIVTP